MAITDIQISEELQTGAPSIKYRGNEGPQSPQEEQMGAQDYSSSQYRMQLIEKLMDQGLDFGAASNEADRLIKLMLDRQRQGSAYGGIAGLDGRRRYGIGSSLKKRIRKLIPNEVADVAVKAAPFVAPFNPIAGGLMAGLGGFDRHGSLSKGLKSGLLTYGGGQLARGIGGGMENLQTGFKVPGGSASGFGQYFSSPIQSSGGIGKMFSDKLSTSGGSMAKDGGNKFTQFTKEALNPADTAESLKLAKDAAPNNIKFLDKFLGKVGMDTAAMAAIVGTSALAGLYTAKNPADDSIEQMRGSGMDIESIRTEVIEAMKDPSGEKLAAIRTKYPFLGAQETKNVGIMAEGGRIGYYAGGQSIPSEYTIEDARKTAMQDKLGGITEVMKRADLYRQGDVGQMYMNQGGRIGYEGGTNYYTNLYSKYAQDMINAGNTPMSIEDFVAIIKEQEKTSKAQGGRIGYRSGGGPYQDYLQDLNDGLISPDTTFNEWLDNNAPDPDHDLIYAQGGRIGAQEGGIMDLGGMEKDYRNTGGFVDIGAKEKADDVPARLSVNEFVMTADAVRGAGDGDIDLGAERMEDLMEKLEAKNKRQQGASDMFEVSERLSAVV